MCKSDDITDISPDLNNKVQEGYTSTHYWCVCKAISTMPIEMLVAFIKIAELQADETIQQVSLPLTSIVSKHFKGIKLDLSDTIEVILSVKTQNDFPLSIENFGIWEEKIEQVNED